MSATPPTLDCGDNSCYFATSKGGMRTNGGCRCLSNAGFSKGMHAAAREMLLEVLQLRKERDNLSQQVADLNFDVEGAKEAAKLRRQREELTTEMKQQRTLLTTMRQSCLAWFDNLNGPWGWECVACGAQFTKSAGPGQPPSETRAYAEVAHDADCVFHPTPRLPSSSDEDLP